MDDWFIKTVPLITFHIYVLTFYDLFCDLFYNRMINFLFYMFSGVKRKIMKLWRLSGSASCDVGTVS